MLAEREHGSRDDVQSGLLPALVGDGRSLLFLLALGLIVSGVFAFFLFVTATFLPQDTAFLGMDPRALCALHQCRLVHFMFHDRVSFGGTLIAVGTLYLWLVAFPLHRGEEWAWWTMLLSGTVGFVSFFCCFLYHYVDTWHGTASAVLLPMYVVGMVKTRGLLIGEGLGVRSLARPARGVTWRSREDSGRACLLFVGAGMLLAGCVIMILGSTVVFVPQDLVFFGFSPTQLNAINPRLIPLIAHDRAGFGGGLASCGLCVFFVMWKSRVTRALWQALFFAGLMGFGCAIGIHYPMGYRSVSHLAPAWVGALVYVIGIVTLWPATQATSSAKTMGATEAAPVMND